MSQLMGYDHIDAVEQLDDDAGKFVHSIDFCTDETKHSNFAFYHVAMTDRQTDNCLQNDAFPLMKCIRGCRVDR